MSLTAHVGLGDAVINGVGVGTGSGSRPRDSLRILGDCSSRVTLFRVAGS